MLKTLGDMGCGALCPPGRTVFAVHQEGWKAGRKATGVLNNVRFLLLAGDILVFMMEGWWKGLMGGVGVRKAPHPDHKSNANARLA